MPFCSQCGKQVGSSDVYCAGCGARQPVAPPSRPADPFSGLSPRAAAILCYVPIVGWIASIVVLASNRFRSRRDIRFHAFQGLYLFVTWLLVDQVFSPMFRFMPGPHFPVSALLHALILFTWIFMMIKASHDEVYSLPILGELAERSITER